jgi:hypothetical protein
MEFTEALKADNLRGLSNACTHAGRSYPNGFPSEVLVRSGLSE